MFALQDELTRSVAAAIEARLLAAEGIRAMARAAGHLGAWDLVAQAQTHYWRLSRADFEAAMKPLHQAVGSYADYAPAHGRLGFCLAFAAHMGWIGSTQGMLASREHATRAIALDDCDPWGHIALGYSAMMERRTEDSIAAFHAAVDLNPSSAAAHSHLSRGLAFAGRAREAIEHGKEAIRLSPVDPEMALFLGALAVAHFTARRYDESVSCTTAALRLRPGFQGAQRLRCAGLAQAGRIEEARAFLASVCREQPDLSADWVRANVPYQTDELMRRFIEGLRMAGLR
jgi:tetratricopeptide (TPR) repeat protein